METACEWRNIHYETLRATYTNSMTKGCEVFLWVKSHFVLALTAGKVEPSEMVARIII